MAAQLPRPGVEIVQEFRSTSPTIIIPTLVPCNVAPFFEIMEVLSADGTLNADSKLSSPYAQLGMTVSQSSFPAPRGNVDQINIDEDSIRAFLSYGGSLLELSRTSGFLTQINIATQPKIDGTLAGPFDLDGLSLVIALDAHQTVGGTSLPTTGDVPTSANFSITFESDGMTITEVIDFINSKVLGIASNTGTGRLRLSSTKYGAGASIMVRLSGSANSVLGFSILSDQIAVGAGFFAIDDADGDLLSPRLEIFAGTTKRDIGASNIDEITPPSFFDLSIEAGDEIVASGTDIGTVQQVFTSRLILSAEQNIFGSDSPFAPRYVWAQARNLEFPAPASSTSANLTGTSQVATETQAYIVAQAPGTYAVGPGESFDIEVSIGGVAQPTEVIGSGGGWVDLTAAITSINTQATNFEAYYSNNIGDEVPSGIATHIAFRTKATNTGSGASLSLTDQSVGMTLGFSSLPIGDVGENKRYLPGTKPYKVGASAFVSTVAAQTIVYTFTFNGVAEPSETITWAANITLAAAITDWNSKAKYTQAYKALSTGVESASGTYFAIRPRSSEANGADTIINVTATDSVPNLPTGSTAGTDSDLDAKTFRWSVDTNPKVYEVVFAEDEDDGSVSMAQVLSAINGLTPGVASESTDVPPKLKLTSGMYGEPSQIKVTDGTANTILGFTTNQTGSGNGRPLADLAIDISGNVLIQNQILRSGLTGEPYAGAGAPIHFSYKALRLDVSPDADNPALLTINSTTQLEQIASPISSDNPGALMTFLTLINSPGTSATAIGVPEVSADAPDGTPIGYAKCFEFLESEEVYAISLGTQSSVIHQAALTHVNFMSEPEQKGERILFFNPKIPERALNTLLGSGTDANTSATPLKVVVEANVAASIIELGIDPSSVNPTTGPIVNEIFLDLAGDDNYYLVQRVENGTDVYLRVAFATGDGNADSFYATSGPTGVISDDWTVAVRGALLLVPGTTSPDKDGIALTIQKTGQAYGFRRGFYVHPDNVGINVTGLEQIVPGYYATSCIIGMTASLPPQQGFTNYPVTGLTQLIKSSDYFSERQLNVIAAGGIYILVQDAEGAPCVCRHQLSTDLSSIETRELSITKVVDFTAKFLRAGLRNFIGRANITQSFLDQLSSVVQGILSFLTESGVLIGADINNVIQDADAPDTVLIDITLDVPYPCNYIRVTLVI